jgi:diketogulonate reductase-like aldo/keto reductase
VLVAVAQRHDVTAAQVALRWSLQRGVVPIPKSVQAGHLRENIDVWGFDLDEHDVARLDALDRDLHLDWDPTDEP